MLSLTTKNIPEVRYLLVSDEMAGQRIDNFLLTHLKGVPRTRIYRILRKGEVRVNKGRIKPDYRLNEGDSIRIPPVRQQEENTTIPHIPAKVERSLLDKIIYEDDDLILINKPAGLAVHGGSGLSFGVIEALRILKPEIKSLELIHRLDRETSGCLLIAKRRSALRCVHEQLRAGQLEKHYLALVKGQWQAGKVVDAPLQKNQLSSGERMVRVSEEGKACRTEFSILTRYNEATLMKIRLITGRTHQIRVHSQYVGHEVAGDPKYGDDPFNRLMKGKGLSRLFLHASRISLNLPKTGERLTLEAPLEGDLNNVLNVLEVVKS